MDIFIDDLIKKLVEMRNDGYMYCDIDIVPSNGTDEEYDVGFISLNALDCGGMVAPDYCDDPDDDVTEVEPEEIETYANQDEPPAPHRKPIKEIKISF